MQRRGSVAAGIDNAQAAETMAYVARHAGVTVPLLIEVDCGLGRAGVQPGPPVLELAKQVASLAGLNLRGVFTQTGHAYAAHSPAAVARIGRAEDEVQRSCCELTALRGNRQRRFDPDRALRRRSAWRYRISAGQLLLLRSYAGGAGCCPTPRLCADRARARHQSTQIQDVLSSTRGVRRSPWIAARMGLMLWPDSDKPRPRS